MDNIEQLQIIREAQGDPALLALATIELTLPEIPDAERSALRLALEAAAVPHWCDATILTELINAPEPVSRDRWTHLKALPVVESFPARGADAGNVHEASRLPIRRYLAETQRTRFMELSARSAQVFAADTRPVSRIEWIYHLLVADPERGAAELEDLDRLFSGSARHEDIAALSAALTELDTTHILQGKALVRARLVVAEYRADVAGASSVSDLATQLLQMAETIEDDLLIGDAYSLVGEAAQARGDLAAAEQSYTQTLAIFKRLAALDPTNTSWQRSLAIAHSRVGDLAQDRGDLAAAEQSYTQTLAISERLAALDPTNTSWQRDLTTAHERVAGVARKGTRRRWRRILKWFGR